eukprot:EC819714.1.p1 GENE.EC819714.1~~EC819714.1.p1  ORF type:complete len:71 (+),score=41.10 EC819714.1:129-341(+)
MVLKSKGPCDGACVCGDCIVIPEKAVGDKMKDEEKDLLQEQGKPKGSRLACQIKVSSAIEGCKFKVIKKE